jgi:hypothetical protein
VHWTGAFGVLSPSYGKDILSIHWGALSVGKSYFLYSKACYKYDSQYSCFFHGGDNAYFLGNGGDNVVALN